VLVIIRSFLFLKDIIAILQALGCSVRNNPLLGPSITPNPFTLGDGGPTEYRVRLTLNGKTVDEAEVKVSIGFD
jgi:uroporphyrinogen-III decarboxylase